MKVKYQKVLPVIRTCFNPVAGNHLFESFKHLPPRSTLVVSIPLPGIIYLKGLSRGKGVLVVAVSIPLPGIIYLKA